MRDRLFLAGSLDVLVRNLLIFNETGRWRVIN